MFATALVEDVLSQLQWFREVKNTWTRTGTKATARYRRKVGVRIGNGIDGARRLVCKAGVSSNSSSLKMGLAGDRGKRFVRVTVLLLSRIATAVSAAAFAVPFASFFFETRPDLLPAFPRSVEVLEAATCGGV